jgi:hypothetical protein
MVIGRICLAHPRHSEIVPIVQHSIRPVTRGGTGTRTVQLCANADGLVHELLDEIEAVALTTPYALVDEVVRSVPRDIWARFPGAVRVIAYRGWQEYGLSFLGGRYDRNHELWGTSGEAKHANTPAFTDVSHAARWSRRWRRELNR